MVPFNYYSTSGAQIEIFDGDGLWLILLRVRFLFLFLNSSSP